MSATRTLTGILIACALAFFGAETLRRQTAREFPDAHLHPGMLGAPRTVAETPNDRARVPAPTAAPVPTATTPPGAPPERPDRDA